MRLINGRCNKAKGRVELDALCLPGGACSPADCQPLCAAGSSSSNAKPLLLPISSFLQEMRRILRCIQADTWLYVCSCDRGGQVPAR